MNLCAYGDAFKLINLDDEEDDDEEDDEDDEDDEDEDDDNDDEEDDEEKEDDDDDELWNEQFGALSVNYFVESLNESLKQHAKKQTFLRARSEQWLRSDDESDGFYNGTIYGGINVELESEYGSDRLNGSDYDANVCV
ncbi:MAG: hypothetical protein EZS28_013932 [Streblomastix strix]|uniref:Uncharacterized protein n=1 Tax=Streblomastix strix TaxID=222440 RepID=A0A5J4W6Y4_9EUKA|nr:MAG: hypothetical protein EZS28_013932 [Streblomastix strix]